MAINLEILKKLLKFQNLDNMSVYTLVSDSFVHVTVMLPFFDYIYICMQHVTTCYHYLKKNSTYISFFN